MKKIVILMIIVTLAVYLSQETKPVKPPSKPLPLMPKPKPNLVPSPRPSVLPPTSPEPLTRWLSNDFIECPAAETELTPTERAQRLAQEQADYAWLMSHKTLASFLKHELGGQDLKELRTKLNGKTLDEILEENETWENQVDTLTRAKRELEAEIISLTNAWKNRLGEKERTITRLQADLQAEQKKVSKKAKLLDEEQTENNQLTKRIEALEKEIAQLRRDNG